jgi:hypothetical protein
MLASIAVVAVAVSGGVGIAQAGGETPATSGTEIGADHIYGSKGTIFVAAHLSPPDPDLVPAACHGKVRVSVMKGKKVVKFKRLTIRKSCLFSGTFKAKWSKKLRVKIVFRGNAQMGHASGVFKISKKPPFDPNIG